jgi:predicted TIM-barrel fold metal-dependent hydrolase
MFAKHPHTTFISLHVAKWPENLDYVSALLDRLPNVVVEFGAREAELGRQPRRAREFFTKYQDRILFGTDASPDPDMYRNHFRWLETADEYFDYWGYPAQGRWKIYGMQLPDSVLEKVYHRNAERIFAQFKDATGRSSTGGSRYTFHPCRLCNCSAISEHFARQKTAAFAARREKLRYLRAV